MNQRITTVFLAVAIAFTTSLLAARSGVVHLPSNQQDYEPAQPIAFSHRLHAGDLQVACLYCHSNAERSRSAGVPANLVCMNCHRFVTAPLGDLYLVPQAIEVGGTWMEAGSAGRIASPGEVTAVAFSARSVPGMSALWGGLALMGFGIAARIASDLPARLRSPR